MKKSLFLCVLIVSFCVSLFAGGTQEVSTDAQSDVVTLTVLTSATTQTPEGPLAEKYFAEFEAMYPNIKLEVEGVPNNQGLQKVTTLAAADSLPDVFCNSESWYAKLVDMGICEDLRPYLTDEEYENIDPSVRAGCETDGALYCYPWYSSPNALVYRADWLAEAGLDEPKTLDDMLEAAIALTKDTNGDGVIDRYGFGLIGTNDDSGRARFIMIMRSMGAEDLYWEDGEWKTDVGNEASIAAFKYFADLKNVYNVVPPGSIENSFNENVNLFAMEQVGMLLAGSNSIGKIFNANPDLKADGKIASVSMPQGVTTYTPAGFIGWSINPASEHKEEAMTFIKFISEKERAIEWVETTGRIPCGTDALESSEYLQSDLFKGFVAGLQSSEFVPDAPFYGEVKNELGKTYQKLLIDPNADVEAEVKACGEAIQRIIDNNK